MNRIFDSGFMKGLQKFGEKLATNRYVSAISGGIMSTLALTMVGAIFQILGTLPFNDRIKAILAVPYNMTVGLMSLIAAFSIAFVLANNLKIKALQSAILSAVLFLIVAAPTETLELLEGGSITAMNSGNLGGTGLFTAIIIALLSVRITKFCIEKKLVIPMPDIVPQFLADSFTAVIPLLLNVILFHGINTLLLLTADVTLPDAITQLLALPLRGLTSTPGIFVVGTFALVLWLFGIHGTLVAFSVVLPMYIGRIMENGAIVAAGGTAEFSPVLLMMSIAAVGGTGCTLGGVIVGLFSKSQQIKAVSRAGIVPGLFGINEPVTFGFPIVFNPILAIPYIFGSLAIMILTRIGYAIGFLHAPHILMMSLMPMGVGEFISTLSWTNAIWPYMMLPVSIVIWYPFMKIYERQLVAKEQAAAEQTQ
jgi:PTS system cellobiose-specific IIC component